MYDDNITLTADVNNSNDLLSGINLAFSKSGVKSKDALSNIGLPELADLLARPTVHEKDGSYFLRATMNGDNLTRSNTNASQSSRLLIIDADSSINTNTGEVREGAPSFKAVSARLATIGIAHIAYTSYSHITKGERYRLVIPTLIPYTPKQLNSLTGYIVDLIGEINGLKLCNVKENNVWAQPWYTGRVNDGYQFIEQLELAPLCYFPPLEDVEDVEDTPTSLASSHNVNPDNGVISLIHYFNATHPIEELLKQYGFKMAQNGRWIHPNSQSGIGGGVILDNGKYYEHGGNGKLSDGLAHDAFDVDCVYGGKSRDYALMVVGAVKLDNGLTIREHNNQCNQQEMMKSGDKQLLAVSHSLADYINEKNSGAQLDVNTIINFWNSTYWNPEKSRFYVMTDRGYEFNSYSETKLKSVFVDLFSGLFLASGDSDLFKQVLNKLLNQVLIHKQASSLSYNVDLWSDKAKLGVKGGMAIAEYPFNAFEVRELDIDDAVAKDWIQHFPQFDEFLDLLVASRFASNRKQSYFWLHAPSNWGKSLLLGVFESLGIVAKVSVSEIEKAFNGLPIGRDADCFINSWVLAIEEFKAINSEIKQLESSLSFAPKFKGTITVPLYMKLFLSAETVDSLAGEAGVDSQFANRFSSLDIGEGLIDERELFKRDSATYFKALVAHTGRALNERVAKLMMLGKREAVRQSERLLREYNKDHSIKINYSSLDDTLKAIADDIREQLKSEDVFGKSVRCVHDDREAMLVQHINKKVADYIYTHFDKSEVTKLNRRKAEIASLVDESDRPNMSLPIRVKIDNTSVLKKGTLIYT